MGLIKSKGKDFLTKLYIEDQINVQEAGDQVLSLIYHIMLVLCSYFEICAPIAR